MDTNKVKVISDLIEKNQRIFKIPVYQRNYDWGTEQCQKLFDDVIKAYQNEKKHFLGTFVYIRGEVDNSTLTEVLVIDGQQRLTTLYILLKALYDSAKDEKINSIYNEIEEYIYNRRCPEEFKIKLKPIQTDNVQLQKLMENKFEDMSLTSNITRNYNFFMELISKVKNFELSDILCGMKKLEMVEIILDKSDGDEPQIIFESINSTGLELNLADLIRNFLLMDDKNQDYLFHEYWIKMEEQIGYGEFEEFLIQYLNSKISKNITMQNAYEKFKSYYNENFKNHEDILKDLKKYSKYYSSFIGKKSNYNSEIEYLLNSFRLLKQTTSYPFLLKIFENHEEKHINDNELINILKFLRSYSIRRIICEVPSNSLRGFYKGLYDRINNKNNKNHYQNLVKLVSELNTKDRIPSDDKFREDLITKNLYKKIACKYILAEIENQTKEKIDSSDLTIEHILPQKENSLVWKEEIGEEYERIYETYLHTLGNLTISGYNSELGTRKFLEKKGIIKEKSRMNILNKDILNAKKWGEASILKRAKNLSDIVLKLFEYEKVDTNFNKIDTQELLNLNTEVDLKNKKPFKFIFAGEEVLVSSYVGMLNEFINLLFDIESKLFYELAKNEYSMTKSENIYIGYDNSKIRKPKKISNTGIFYETNLSSEYIILFIKNLLIKSGFDIEDFEFAIK
jgi:hypothetical protein